MNRDVFLKILLDEILEEIARDSQALMLIGMSISKLERTTVNP
jgi:hypothetical protein